MSTDPGENPVLEVKQIHIVSINSIKYVLLISIKLQQQRQRKYQIYSICTATTKEN